MGVARRLSVVTAVFAIAALVAGTAGTSYAKPHHKGPDLLDTVVVSNNGALFAGQPGDVCRRRGERCEARIFDSGHQHFVGRQHWRNR